MKELVTNQRFLTYPNINQRVKKNLVHSVKEKRMMTMMSMIVKITMIKDDDQENDSGETESDDHRDDFVHPNLSTYKADDQEEEKEEEKANDNDEVSFDQRGSTPPDYELTDEEENQEDDDNVMGGEQEDEEVEELYGDLNLNLDRRDAEMTDAQINQETEEVHVTLSTELLVVQQQSFFISSDLVSKFINPSPDTVEVAVQLQSNKLKDEAQAENQEFLKTIDSNMKAIIKEQVKAQVSRIMPKIEKYVTESLGAEILVSSTNQHQTSYAAVASLSEFELKKILIDKIDIFASYGDVVTLKRGRDDQDKDKEPSTRSNRGTKRRRSGKEESSKEATQKESKSTSSSKGASRSQPKSSGKSAQAEEHGSRVDELEEPLHQEFNTGNDDVSPAKEVKYIDERLWNPSSSQTPDREWHKTKTVNDQPPQSWMTQLAQASATQSSFDEFLATPIDFSAFMMNRLKIDNLTQDVLTGPTYHLVKGTCKSIVELEYHLEEVFKATHDQLDWNNPEGRSYPP
ncbi:hypothetical protein Tco_1202212 [Tanacetum coccineum]